jgi:hypothetical protein
VNYTNRFMQSPREKQVLIYVCPFRPSVNITHIFASLPTAIYFLILKSDMFCSLTVPQRGRQQLMSAVLLPYSSVRDLCLAYVLRLTFASEGVDGCCGCSHLAVTHYPVRRLPTRSNRGHGSALCDWERTPF